AVSNNIRKWNYVKTILNDCVNNQIKTLEQYTIKQREFKNKKANKTTVSKKQEVTYNTDFSEYDQYVKRD
ncbi:MAG: DnaD domain protein, partial [Clostridia bacterium]